MAAANRRGHLCPSDDRDSTAEENRTTFILTNIISQAPTQNRQAWRLLEEYARSLVAQGKPRIGLSGYGRYSILKFRVADSGNKRGQSGGFRVIAATNIQADEIYFLYVYPKNGTKGIEDISDAFLKELVIEFGKEQKENKLVRLDLNANLAELVLEK